MIDPYVIKIEEDKDSIKMLFNVDGLYKLNLEIKSKGTNNILLSNNIVAAYQDIGYTDVLIFGVKKDGIVWEVYDTKCKRKLNIKELNDYVDEYMFNKDYKEEDF